MILHRVETGVLGNISLLQFRGGQQFMITLPKDLILALGWKPGCKIEFTLDDELQMVMKKL